MVDNKINLAKRQRRGGKPMERKLRAALLNIIADYNDIVRQINDAQTPASKAQFIAQQEALHRVLQQFAQAEYIEYVDGQWRIKIIVMERG